MKIALWIVALLLGTSLALAEEAPSIVRQNPATGMPWEIKEIEDKALFSIDYTVKLDRKKMLDIQSFTTSYSRRWSSFWLDFFAGQVRGLYSTLVGKAPIVTSKEKKVHQSIVFAGVGISYQSKLLGQFLGWKHAFESIGAGLGYYSMEEFYQQKKYAGLGLKSHFKFLFRNAKALSYGIKFSHTIVPIKGEGKDGVLMSWASMGFSLVLNF